MIEFSREQANASNIKEVIPLLESYRREVDYYTNLKLDPEFDRYEQLEKSNALRAYTARLDGKLIGFVTFIFFPHLHFKNNIFALHDILYIIPEHRGFGYKFLKWCNQQLESDGASVILYSVSLNYDYGPLLKRIGFRVSDHVYSKELK